MSQFPPALEYILNNEDRNRNYAIVPDTCSQAIAGVNSNAWPSAFANIVRLPQAQRSAAVANFYKTEFWDVMRLEGINSQDLANRVLDEGVNAGPYTSTRMLQHAINVFLTRKIAEDGILGPVSLKAINCAGQENLLMMFRSLRMQRYQNIIAEHPEDAKYLAAWEARAKA